MKTKYLCLDDKADKFVRNGYRWVFTNANSNMGRLAYGTKGDEHVLHLSNSSCLFPLSLSESLLVTENAKITGKLLRSWGVSFNYIVGLDDLVRYVDGAAADASLPGTAARHHLVYRNNCSLMERLEIMRRLADSYLPKVPQNELKLISHTHHLYTDPVIEIDSKPLVKALGNIECRHRGQLRGQEAAAIRQLRKLIGLAAENRKRLPVFLNYMGAITGRFTAGGGFNFQGLPKVRPNQDEVIQQAYGAIRSALKAPEGFQLLSADVNAMEPRIMAWLSCDSWLITKLIIRQKLYAEFGQFIFNIPRSGELNEVQHRLAKVIFIGLQYGAGAFRLWEMLKEQLSDDERTQLLGNWTEQRRCCYQAVQVFDRVCPNIVLLRRAYGNAFGLARRGESRAVGPVAFAPWGEDGVAVTLPSGRKLIYDNVETKKYKQHEFNQITADGIIEHRRGEFDSVSYRGADGRRESIYDAKLLQNIVQAIGRDLLAEMILNAEHAGIRVVGHIHDELVALVADDDVVRASEVLGNGDQLLQSEWATEIPLVMKTAVGASFQEI